MTKSEIDPHRQAEVQRIESMARRLLAAREGDSVVVQGIIGQPTTYEIALSRPGLPTFRFHVHTDRKPMTDFDIIKAVDEAGWSCC